MIGETSRRTTGRQSPCTVLHTDPDYVLTNYVLGTTFMSATTRWEEHSRVRFQIWG